VFAYNVHACVLSGVGLGIAVQQKRSGAAALLHCSYTICSVLILWLHTSRRLEHRRKLLRVFLKVINYYTCITCTFR